MKKRSLFLHAVAQRDFELAGHYQTKMLYFCGREANHPHTFAGGSQCTVEIKSRLQIIGIMSSHQQSVMALLCLELS